MSLLEPPDASLSAIETLVIDGPTADLPPDANLISRFFRSAAMRRFVTNVPAVIGVFVVLLVAVLCAVGPLFVADPNSADVFNKLALPRGGHVLGTDYLGRDTLARLLDGATVSLTVAFAASILAVLLSMVIGIWAGYFGGAWDLVLSRVFDVMSTFPMILLAVLIVVALGPSLGSTIIAISIAVIPRYGRQFRILTRYCKERQYVQAAISMGYSTPRIIVRHVLPNIAIPIAVIAAGNMAPIALAEAGLSFLGAGTRPPNASLGNMISDALPYIQTSPLQALIPGVVLCMLTISFSFIGDGLRDAFDLSE
jgi:ABC-type dipeptide/oligopeptide/nickel transport system permease subunit